MTAKPTASIPLEKEFSDCVTLWRNETKGHSALGKKFLHPAYQRILGMGEKALPLIFAELNQRPDHWFWALRFITGTDVAVDSSDFAEAREKWLEWRVSKNC